MNIKSSGGNSAFLLSYKLSKNLAVVLSFAYICIVNRKPMGNWSEKQEAKK